MQRFALGLMLSIVAPTVLTSTTAHAQNPGLAIAGDGNAERDREARRRKFDERHELEDFQREPERKGFYVGSALLTGMTVESNSFIPSVGYRFEIGGGLTDRVTLGISGGLTGHLGILKGGAGVADVVLRGFVHRGLFFNLGLGATSHAPQRNLVKRPGFGGIAGVGYEFRPLRVLGVAIGVDYEGRVRTDGIFTQAVVLGLGLRAYLDFRKMR
jgi:hypothetical protein